MKTKSQDTAQAAAAPFPVQPTPSVSEGSGFTKGPWRVKHTDTTFYVESADGVRIVSTSWHGHIRKPYPLKAEAFANVQLSAAAPAMFEALKAARRFIANGIELGFIRMPDAGTPDPAHDTLPAIDAALSLASGSNPHV